MSQIFSICFPLCCLTYGVNILVRVLVHVHAVKVRVFFLLTRRNADDHVRMSASIVVLDRVPPRLLLLFVSLEGREGRGIKRAGS